MSFIYNLYQQDNFILILGVILVLLILLFVGIYFWGRKDKKLEETRRLEKIELEAFKKVEEEPKEVEVKAEDNLAKEDTLELPELKEEEVNVTLFEPTEEVKEEEIPYEVEVTKPIFSDVDSDEAKPISLEELDQKLEDDELDIDLTNLENIKKEFNEIKLPEEEKEEEVKPIFKPSPQIFSSVFVNKPDLNTEVATTKIEENEVVSEEIEEVKPKLFTIVEDDEDLELPSLNEEVNVSNLEKEIYEIK